MKGFYLSEEELVDLHAAHRAERNRNNAYKINAVILLGTGWNLKQVKTALLIDDETLRSYVDKYRFGGIKTLLENNHTGRKPNLDADQLSLLHEELDKNIHLSTQSIIEFVSNTFCAEYTQSGMRDLLHREGYTYKKPKLVPGTPDLQAQEDFVRYYEQFMQDKGKDAAVFFLDAVHPEHNTMAGFGWIKKGEDKKLKTNSGRQRLNLHGAINVETMEMTVIESDTINRDSTVQLLETLERRHGHYNEIYIILDNARYHYSEEVTKVIRSSRRLKLIYLPSYSPQLNLIERVWKFFKKKVLYNKYYETIGDFRKAAIKFFRSIDDYSDQLHKLLSGGFEGFNYA